MPALLPPLLESIGKEEADCRTRVPTVHGYFVLVRAACTTQELLCSKTAYVPAPLTSCTAVLVYQTA